MHGSANAVAAGSRPFDHTQLFCLISTLLEFVFASARAIAAFNEAQQDDDDENIEANATIDQDDDFGDYGMLEPE